MTTSTITIPGAGGDSLSIASGNDGTFTLFVGPTGAKVLALSIGANGVVQQGQAQSMVRLNTANGYGSTNTKIRRFTNVVTNQGSDITYADSATLGASFTINTSGVYSINYSDNFTAASNLGLTLNAANGITNVGALSASSVLNITVATAANTAAAVSWTGYLSAGSIINPIAEGTAAGTGASAQFTIVRVA